MVDAGAMLEVELCCTSSRMHREPVMHSLFATQVVFSGAANTARLMIGLTPAPVTL